MLNNGNLNFDRLVRSKPKWRVDEAWLAATKTRSSNPNNNFNFFFFNSLLLTMIEDYQEMKTNLDFLDLPTFISGTQNGHPRNAPFVASENAGTVRLLSRPQPPYVEPNIRTVQEVEAKGIELCQSNAMGFLRLICAGITGNKATYMSAMEVFGKVFNTSTVKFSKPHTHTQTFKWLLNSVRVHSYLLRTYPDINCVCWTRVVGTQLLF